MNLPNHRHKKLYQPVRVDKFVNVNLALSTSTLLLMRNILLILPAAVMTGILLSGCDKNSKDEPVSPTLEDIVLDTTDLVLDIGETYTLGVEIYPANADAQLTWMSTDATVASVSDAGKVTANWRFRSKDTQKTDDYFGVKPPKKDPIINKKGRALGSRASIFRSIATQLS